ncbi:CaiB/BaiF CoA transferase family protein [Dechloromonas denitrificans]|uniref:CaiB/BaiF CoA transferase family protein n=1 Tax=Dechloromonas denitrificans TaxID=281362 RepID=UPI001CFA9811|nr:CaiB/BaiF CoA-transferase family protein [Dechloromonas denitrificans]UCV08242.1 CoA transferase [Dechloromonas denitrificans]
MSRPGPLAGIRILDLTRLLPGPVATLHLADLGAEVIKIEDPQVGDYARTLGTGQGEDSAYFRMINRNKQGLRLDLKKPEGVDIFLRLAGTVDVIVESFRPGVMDKLGIGYATVAALNPKIAYCSISGYGQDGPYRDLAGHDINYLGYSGVLDQIGSEGDQPAIPNFQIADLLGGALTAAMGILAAVLEAQRTGQGRYIDVSMTDSVLAHTYFTMLRLNDAGQSAPRGTDMLTGGLPCYATYRCADGKYMAVGALEGKFWAICCKVLARPDWVARQWDASLRSEMATVFAGQPRDAWAARFAAADCCVTPVLTPEEALDNEQIAARGMVVKSDGLTQFAPPLKMSDFQFAVRQPAPKSGEHNTAILLAAGYSPEQIEHLTASGALG